MVLDRQEEASVRLLISPTRLHLAEGVQHPKSGPLALYPNQLHYPVGPRFILCQNWLSKLPLFFSKTKKMLIGRDEDNILNPNLHIYIKYPRCQMRDKTR